MNGAILDPYKPGTSILHKLDARVKLAAAVAIILIANLTPIEAWPAFVGHALLLLVVIASAELSLLDVAKRSLLAAPFVLIAAIGLPFVREGKPLLSIPLLSSSLVITDVGALRFANAITKSWLSVITAIVLIFVTRFPDILRAMRSLGVPIPLTSIIMLMYRYMFVLVEEAMRLLRARDARSGALPGKKSGASLRWRASVTGHMIGTLFLRTYERSERIYQAMLARGYVGEIHVLSPRPMRISEALLGAAAVAAFAAASMTGLFFG